MIVSIQFFERVLFTLIAFAFCVLLSFRPIPSELSENDTGRYVTGLHQYCAGSVNNDLINKELSYNIFYAATSPACIIRSDGFFLFEVAFFLPLSFLLFSSWRIGTLSWACCLLFSVFGVELMTNAMRQGFAMFLFFGSLALVRKHLVIALLLGALAVCAHISTLTFYPLLLWISGMRLSKRTWVVGMVIVILIVIVSWLFFQSAIVHFFSKAADFHIFYTAIYAEKSNVFFMLFMVLPLYFVYGLRRVLEKKYITVDEQRAVINSTILLLASLIFFPAISYRLIMFAVPLQIFLVTLSDHHSLKISGIAFFGFTLHLFVMIYQSKYYDLLINS